MIHFKIKKKLKPKDIKKLMNFIFTISDEISFSALHNYHLDEEKANEILNEYRQVCIQRHRILSDFYQRNSDPYVIKNLFYVNIHTKEEFDNFNDELFQEKMAMSQDMEILLESLQKTTKHIDYRQLFPMIATDFKQMEIHMFDSSTLACLLPIDTLFYHLSDKIKTILENLPSLIEPCLITKDKKCRLDNPVFYKNNEEIVSIDNETGYVYFDLEEDQYERFKKLNIKY